MFGTKKHIANIIYAIRSRNIILKTTLIAGLSFGYTNAIASDKSVLLDKTSSANCQSPWKIGALVAGSKLGYSTLSPKKKKLGAQAKQAEPQYYLNIVREYNTPEGLVREFAAQTMLPNVDGDKKLAYSESAFFKNTEAIFTTGIYSPRHSHLKFLPHKKMVSEIHSNSFATIRNMRIGEAVYLKARFEQQSRGKGLLKKDLVATSDIRVEYLDCSTRKYAGQKFIARSFLQEYEKTVQTQNAGKKTYRFKYKLYVDDATGIPLESMKYNQDGNIDSHSILVEITTND